MNLAKDALHVLGSLAPTVATAIGGPFAGMAVNALESALGDKVTGSTPQDRQKSLEGALLSGDPATLLKIRESENLLTEKMAEIGIQKDKLVYDDLANARAMNVATKDPTPARLAWLMVGGFLLLTSGIIVGLFIWPDRAKELLSGEAGLFFGTVFGYLSSEAKQVAAFYFGSSADSQAKTQTLSEIAKS